MKLVLRLIHKMLYLKNTTIFLMIFQKKTWTLFFHIKNKII